MVFNEAGDMWHMWAMRNITSVGYHEIKPNIDKLSTTAHYNLF